MLRQVSVALGGSLALAAAAWAQQPARNVAQELEQCAARQAPGACVEASLLALTGLIERENWPESRQMVDRLSAFAERHRLGRDVMIMLRLVESDVLIGENRLDQAEALLGRLRREIGESHLPRNLLNGGLLLRYGRLSAARGRPGEAAGNYRDALAIFEPTGLFPREAANRLRWQLASQLTAAGQHSAADPHWRAFIAADPNGHASLVARVSLARGLRTRGRLEEAEQELDQALLLSTRLYTETGANTATVHLELGQIQGWLHKWEAAETSLRTAMRIRRQHFAQNEIEIANVAIALSCIVHSRDEKLQLRSEALAIYRTVRGEADPATATAYLEYGSILAELGWHERAREMGLRGLAILQRSSERDGHRLALAHGTLGRIFHWAGDFGAAQALYARSAELYRTSLEVSTTAALYSEAMLAEMWVRRGIHPHEAYDRLARVMPALVRPVATQAATSVNITNELLVYRPQMIAQVRAAWAAAHPESRAAPRARAGQGRAPTPGQARHQPATQLPALGGPPLPPLPAVQLPRSAPVRPVRPLAAGEYREGAFRAAQWAFRGDAAVALDRLAARFAAGDSEGGVLERELILLGRQQFAVEHGLASALRETDAGSADEVTALRAELARLERERAQKLQEIEDRFPQYAELVRPHSYGLEEIRGLLGPDEALLFIVSAEDATYVFAASSERYDWYRSADLTRSELREAVTRLRGALDRRDGPLASTAPDSADLAFDRRAAHRLFRELIAPAQEIIGNRRNLLTVTGDALATLPLSVLVTDAPSGDDRDEDALAETRWLADRHVVSSLPSVSSLVALRCHLAAQSERSPRCPSDARSGALAAPGGARLELAGAGAPILRGLRVVDRGSPVAMEAVFGAGQIVDPDMLRANYGPLDGARQELETLRRRFGARSHILLGTAATEREIKRNSAFSSARYVIFATHGVLGGRGSSFGEPGLVFTPPAAGQQDRVDDGYLTASEIAQMRFSSDFVILSGCNTAGGDIGAGEGLSGLARAFFYAGARSLVVSHWYVDDTATSSLMTRMFDELDSPQPRTRGEAISAAMASLRSEPGYAHPRYWAAFSLVGDAR